MRRAAAGLRGRVSPLSGRGFDAARMTRGAMLSEEMWARSEPVLSPVQGVGGRLSTPHRPAVEGAIHRYQTGG